MVRRVLLFKPSSLAIACAFAGATAGQAAFAQSPEFVQEYCVKCHNLDDYSGGLDLEGLDLAHADANADVWEKVIRKVKAGMMPPAGQKRPERATMDAFAVEVEQLIDAKAELHPAAPALHRLNRNEYANAIRDIFGIDINAAALLPQDDASEGFDNIASGLGISPALIQGYTSAAMKISRSVVGDMTATESARTWQAPAGLAQDQHIEGMPLGTRGGLKFTYNFPLDAEYDFSVRGGFGFGRVVSTRTVLMLDGKELKVDDLRSFRLPMTAGEHELIVAVQDIKRPAGVNDIYSVYSVGGGISSVEINGPFNASGPGHTASRERIFSCYPQSNDEERRCAEQIAVNIATQAFREPVSVAQLEPVMAFYEQGKQQGNFETGVQQALSRILLDPRFLFRFEEEPDDVAAGAAYRINDIELATRLSFFLWSSIPDSELLNVAAQNQLNDPQVMREQVLRMLADPKAQALVDNFAGQWLYLRALNDVTPEAADFDENLRQAFIEETELLFGNVIAEDRPVTELLTADYTFLNERLARHYDIDGVRGSHFRRVQLPADNPRRGLLGHGSILTVTSTASRTSPVIRGSWILGNLLSAPVPDPPPGVETNLDGDGSVVLTNSVRERLEQHRADPSCSSCHSVIDPVGFSLENFDAIGAWRVKDGDSDVDTSGVLVDGTPVASAEDLRTALMTRSELFVSTFTEKLLTYALGRAVEYHDMPAVRSIMHDAESTDHSFTSLVMGIVQSPQFTQRIKSDSNATVAANTAQ